MEQRAISPTSRPFSKPRCSGDWEKSPIRRSNCSCLRCWNSISFCRNSGAFSSSLLSCCKSEEGLLLDGLEGAGSSFGNCVAELCNENLRVVYVRCRQYPLSGFSDALE